MKPSSVSNIVVSHRPVYSIGEWAAPHDPAMLGLEPGDATALNDDRLGRMLDRLFDADPASLITETVLQVIRDFDVEVAQLHNDSTTVTVTGPYPDADGRTRGGKATPAIPMATTRTTGQTSSSCCSSSLSQPTGRCRSPTGSPTATLSMTSPTSRPGTSYEPWWAGRTSATSRTASSARKRRWATSPATVGASSPSCPTAGARTPGSATGHRPMRPHGWRPTVARAPGSVIPDRVWRTFEAPAPSTDG
jgi:hypothetical protein